MNPLNLKKLQNGSDIRGIALAGTPGEEVNLTEEAASLLTAGFCTWLARKTGKAPAELTISIGHDPRLSAESLKSAAIRAMTALGISVLDSGLASTPAMFMSTVFPEYRCDGAIMITASHLPKNRNGFKYFDADGGLNKSDITEIIALAEESPAAANAGSAAAPGVCGRVRPCDLMDTYCRHLRQLIQEGVHAENPGGCSAAVADHVPTYARPLAGLSIVIDAGNGAGGFYAEKVLAPLGADVSASQFLTPDGNFPNHAPNPEDSEAMRSVSGKVLSSGANLGLIFDTDVDRSAAVDENGRAIARDGIVALASALIARGNPKSTVVTDSITSNPLRDFLENTLGLSQLRYKRGYKNVINKAIELNGQGINCPLAIETSGHAAFKENYFLDDGAYLATKIVIEAALLAREGKNISCVLRELKEPREVSEVRIPIRTENFADYGKKILDALSDFVSSYGENAEMTLTEPNYEGVRIDFSKEAGNGWCLLRMSLHDPIMPLNIQSDSPGGCRKIAETLRPFLTRFEHLDLSGL